MDLVLAGRDVRPFFVCVAALGAASCATTKEAVDPASEHQWAANGWMTADREGDPEIIGLFSSRRDCKAALNAWLAAQAVEAPVHGECLTIDRR